MGGREEFKLRKETAFIFLVWFDKEEIDFDSNKFEEGQVKTSEKKQNRVN